MKSQRYHHNHKGPLEKEALAKPCYLTFKKGTYINWNSASIKGLLFQEPWKPGTAFRNSMDGLVLFLKDQPFCAVSSIILMNQGALN